MRLKWSLALFAVAASNGGHQPHKEINRIRFSDCISHASQELLHDMRHAVLLVGIGDVVGFVLDVLRSVGHGDP